MTLSTETCSDLAVGASSSKCGAQATFKITNNGDRSGACVAQVYVHEARPSVEKPDLELGGFAKVILQPRESRDVTVALDVSDCSGMASTAQTDR